MAEDTLMIDDRRSGGFNSNLNKSWRLITDSVMGGKSSGELSLASIDNRDCLRLRGDVSLANRGGFIQVALDLTDTAAADASSYTGLSLVVRGNGEEYNVHIRTDYVWLPWQSYRASFRSSRQWQTVRLPFDQFTGYRIGRKLDLENLERIGLVAIGRAFAADLCVAQVGLYREAR